MISQVIRSLSQESPLMSYQQCLNAVVNLCSSIDDEPKECYDLTAPSLIPLQVEVESFLCMQQHLFFTCLCCKIVDTTVCCICQEVAGHNGSYHWLGGMIKLLNQVGSILWTLVVRLWELLTKQVCRHQYFYCSNNFLTC